MKFALLPICTLFASIWTPALVSAPAGNLAQPVPSSSHRVSVDMESSRARYDLLLLEDGAPSLVDIDGHFYTGDPCWYTHEGKMGEVELDDSGVADAFLNSKGRLVVVPSSVGVGFIKVKMKVTKSEAVEAAPSAPECATFYGSSPELELTVKVRVEAPDRVQVRHSELESRETKMYALPGATASLRFLVLSKSGDHLTGADNRTTFPEVALPGLTLPEFTMSAPAIGKTRVVESTVGDTFSLETVDPASLETVDVAFGRRESRKSIYGIMKPRDSWDGDKPIQAYVTSLATKTHPIHYAEIGTLSSIEVHTPKKCAATTEDPTPMLSDPPEFLEEPLWVGNITPLEAGSCTFTVHVGGAETTYTLELTY